MPVIKHHLSCTLQNGEASLYVYSLKPGDLSFVTLRDLHAFVCKERKVAFNTVSKACVKLSNKCVDRELIQELVDMEGPLGKSTTCFRYIKTHFLSESLKKLQMSNSKVKEVSDALEALQSSAYARQSAAVQQLTTRTRPPRQGRVVDAVPSIALRRSSSAQSLACNTPTALNHQRATPDLSLLRKSSMHSGSDVNPLLSLLPYGSDSDTSDDGDFVPGYEENDFMPAAPAHSDESGKDDSVQQQLPVQAQRNVLVPDKQPMQYMKPLEQRYTSIPAIDWRQRCPHLLAEDDSEAGSKKQGPKKKGSKKADLEDTSITINLKQLEGTPVRSANIDWMVFMQCRHQASHKP